MMQGLTIGIDIGGTRTKSGLIDLHTGEVLDTVIHPTEKKNEYFFIEQVKSVIRKLRLKAEKMGQEVKGIGFGVPAFVDEKGFIDTTYGFLEFMDHYPLAAIIENELRIPCRVDNDARVVALGEALYGAGKSIDRVLVLTLGTGLGVSFVVNQGFTDKWPLGHMGGHISITGQGGVCYCGKTGCLEALVSSTGIIDAANKLDWQSKYPDLLINAETIFREAKNGLADARRIVDGLIGYLNTGIHNYINLFAPGMIVLGGGISKGLFDYLDKIGRYDYLPPYTGYTVQIVTSRLQEQAGMIGAAALFQNKINNQ